MKLITKLVAASILALSAITPALAQEEKELLERNTYLFTPDARPIVQHQQNIVVRAHRGTEAQAFAPADTQAPEVRDSGVTAY